MVDPAILLASAAMLITIGIRLWPPQRDQLLEVRRAVESYSFISVKEREEAGRTNGRSRSNVGTLFLRPTTILRLHDRRTGLPDHQFPQVWTDALKEREANELFRVLPVEIRVFVDPENRPTFDHVAGAVRAYGLQVDGRDIQTVEFALSSDRLRIIAGSTLVQILVALMVWRKRRYRARNEMG